MRIVSITTYGASVRLLYSICSVCAVVGSVAILAGGIVHHGSAQAGSWRLCKREPTSSFCNTEADQVSSAIAAEHWSCVRPCNRNYSGKCRYRLEVELWLQFHVYRVREVPRIWRKLSTYALWAAITTVAVNTSTVIITNSFVVVSTHPAVQASEVLWNGNRSKLCQYISVRSNLLALNGWLLHGAVFGLSISVNPTIVGRKMTATVRAQWRYWIFSEFQ